MTCLATVLDSRLVLTPRVPQHERTEKLTRSLRILVAEDNVVNQNWSCGCSRTRLPRGRRRPTAWRPCGATTLPYDLVLMDWQMPEMDGFEATQAIRDYERQVLECAVIPAPNSSYAVARSRGSRIPIIALTANAMRDDQQQCLNAGMDAYITKPVRLEQLLDLIEKFAGVPELKAVQCARDGA